MALSSDKGTDYALESGSNFEDSNYSDEATERRSKIRKLLKNPKSEQMIENIEALEENFKECISKVKETIVQQTFVGLQGVLKMSSRHVLKTPSTSLQRNNFLSSKTS